MAEWSGVVDLDPEDDGIAEITVNGIPVRFEQTTILSIRWTPEKGWEDLLATQTSSKMPIQFPLRPKPAKKPTKGGKRG